jgi:hypothetical protein
VTSTLEARICSILSSTAMAIAASAPRVHDLPRERAAVSSSLWPLYAVLFASTSVIIGVLWDISWHQTIGRDTFWTPAHLAIYLGGIVSGLTCGWIALSLTFGGDVAARAEAVRFWGFRAPLGAWVCIWGAFAMVTSAPFDDWWHNTYGLDVKILSPPHAVLAAGIAAIQLGAMLMALASLNRTRGVDRRLQTMFLYSAGLMLLMFATLTTEYTGRWGMHRSLFYQVGAGVFPLVLVSAARASSARWPATTVAAVYTAVTFMMLWILPLFAGRPLLGPIHVQVERFIPPDPPLLLIVPAVAIDLMMRRWRSLGDWRLAAGLAIAYLAVLLAVQWPFADFLTTSWARNWVFGVEHIAYMVPPEIQARWHQLNPPDDLVTGLSKALALGFVSTRVALWWGNWMARVQR